MGVGIQTYRARIGTYRHSNGVDVVTLVLVVNFSRGLKAIGSVLFIGLLLVMAGIERNPGPRKHGSKPQTMSENLVEDDSEKNVSKDNLIQFFENKNRKGDSPVKHVKINEENHNATVGFEEAEAVTTVLKKQPIIVQATEVHISTSGNDMCPSHPQASALAKFCNS